MLLSVLIRCSLLLTVWFLQRFIKEARNSLFVDGLRSPIGERLASFRWIYSFSISSELFSPATRKVYISSPLVSNGLKWLTACFAGWMVPQNVNNVQINNKAGWTQNKQWKYAGWHDLLPQICCEKKRKKKVNRSVLYDRYWNTTD